MSNFFRLFRSNRKEEPLVNPQPIPQPEPPKQSGHLPHLRRVRNRKPPFELQDRDVELIQAVLENRFLTASLFKLLFPPDKAKTPPHVFTAEPKRSGTNIDRRLSKLFHHSYLQRMRTEMGGEVYYALTSKGAQLLSERQLPLPLNLTLLTDWEEKNRSLSRQYIEHAVMVARFHTAMICALREHPTLRLDHYEREGKDLKAELKREGKTISVIPDAFFVLKDTTQPEGKQRTAYFLEADRSTMYLPRLLEKYTRYSLMYANRIHHEAFGIPSFRVLTVCKSKERASNILKLAAAEASAIPATYKNFFYFTTEEVYKDEMQNIFAEIWKRADEPKPFRSILRADPLPIRQAQG
jgi:DNA-binding PadR family transcriptional regulator